MTSLLGFLLFVRCAFAVCFDPDGDGWGSGTGCTAGNGDCDQGDTDVNPAASEDGIDVVDDDCDGSPAIRRAYVLAFEALFTNDWTASGSAGPYGSGLARFLPTSTIPASISLDDNFAWTKGRFTVNVRFAQAPTTACSVAVGTNSGSPISQSLGTPTGAATVTATFLHVKPGDTISDLQLICVGAGEARFDWLTVQNGPYIWAPLMDLHVSFSDMAFGGGGRPAFVRMSEDPLEGDRIRLMGSDVGGFGYSEDGYTWYKANGLQEDLNTQSRDGVWDAWSTGDGTARFVAILTGNKGDNGAPGEYGGLFYTDDVTDPAQSWTLVPPPGEADGGGIGGTKHYDECETGVKPVSSGKLLVRDLVDGSLILGSQASGFRGVWVWDPASPTTPPHTILDTTNLPPAEDAFVSALAIAGEHLLVGYHVLAGANDPDVSALYDCLLPSGGALSAADDIPCVPLVDDTDEVTTAFDVRDIEAVWDVNEETVTAFVADGGRTYDGVDCGFGEPTVYAVEIDPLGVPTVFDTDGTGSNPTWSVDDTSTPVTYHGSASECGHAYGVVTYGDLVPPTTTGEGSEMSSILLSPDGAWLFAFFPEPYWQRDYGCARVFRVATSLVAAGTTPWVPFQGWEGGEMDWTAGAHAEARRAVVEMNGVANESEPLREVWGLAYVHDATWEPSDGTASPSENPNLLAIGDQIWRVFAEDAPTPGWDTVRPSDPTYTTLDEVAMEVAWESGSATFQNEATWNVAVCPACGPQDPGYTNHHLDTVIAGATADYRMAKLYARNSSGARAPADRPCQVTRLPAVYAVWASVWRPFSTGEVPQVWMPFFAGVSEDPEDLTPESDPGLGRSLIFLADASVDNGNDDEWCFDGYGEEHTAAGNFLKDDDLDYVWELYCQDGGSAQIDYTEWLTCDADTIEDADLGFPMFNSGMGMLTRIVAVAENEAIGLAIEATLPTGTGGEGLWHITYDSSTPSSGLSYEEVYFDSSIETGSCTKADLFALDSLSHVAVDRELLTEGNGDVALYLTAFDGPCAGLYQVAFNLATATTAATWTRITIPSGCPLSGGSVRGAAPAADGRFVYVYGGVAGTTGGGVCRLDVEGSSPVEVVFDEDELLAVYRVLPHPQLDDLLWIGTIRSESQSDPASGPGGIFLAQRRFRAGSSPAWQWGWVKHGYMDMEHRRIADLDWGTGDGRYGEKMANVYAATFGGGYWDGALDIE